MQKLKKLDKLFYEKLGKEIRHYRESRNMTQKELAQKTGFSRPLIVNFEYGYTQLNQSKWKKICNALDIPSELEVTVKVARR